MIEARIDGEKIAVTPALALKYSTPGPRYTSYPTAPNWLKSFGPAEFYQTLLDSNASNAPLSLYFHLPFCEERCTFCACSVVATKRRGLTDPYLKALLREIEIVSEALDSTRPVTQIHWGGGTPTYLSSDQMEKLHRAVSKHFNIADDAEISIEIDPRVTTDEQLITLRDLGFNRISLGVQDFEPEVQELAGRIQSEAETRHTVLICRALGFQGINIDLVYGLPKQTPQTFCKTLEKVLALNPDRIALFNFAYVPWMHAHQKKISETDLPQPFEKLKMFCGAVETFETAGFKFIGLDHFAKNEDELARAKWGGTLHRNFQGYTTKAGCDLIGLGMTSISYVAGHFAQNAKKLAEYQSGVFQTGLTTHAGLKLSLDDLSRQTIIRELFCHQKVFLNGGAFQAEREKLKPFEEDGLVRWEGSSLHVTPLGRLFLRNIGMVFDAYLKPDLKPDQKRFSKTI